MTNDLSPEATPRRTHSRRISDLESNLQSVTWKVNGLETTLNRTSDGLWDANTAIARTTLALSKTHSRRIDILQVAQMFVLLVLALWVIFSNIRMDGQQEVIEALIGQPSSAILLDATVMEPFTTPDRQEAFLVE